MLILSRNRAISIEKVDIKVYTFYMKSVNLKDLKKRLSYWVDETAKGNVVEVTRYNKPYIRLVPRTEPSLHYGSKVGKAELESSTKSHAAKQWLKTLLDDRSE